jgi:CO/xanthine dehydrogenase Mo-binding subunit
MRELIGRELGYEPDEIEVVQVSTDDLPQDPGAGGSRVTASIAMAVDTAVKAWRERLHDEPVTVVVNETGGPPVGSFSVQLAQVAVDPATGETKVLEVLSAIDVAEIINPKAHQMQVDGGTTQGFGFASLEDLDESEGQVWAANLGEFKIPSARDVPVYRTILVPGGRGVGTANVKNIGESTNPPTAAAIANAIANATGVRVRDLPLRAERVYFAMKGPSK